MHFWVLFVWMSLGLCFPGSSNSVALAADEAELYGVWEIQVSNSNSYSNPFDFRVIELRAAFTGPSGKTVPFFGFYDGDGEGGQTGSVWKLRFMADEVGTWTYEYTWTDGTPGGSGTFDVVDTGLPGNLMIAADNPWYFMTRREQPFHARPYDLHHLGPETDGQKTQWNDASPLYIETIQEKMISRGYNMTMIDAPSQRQSRYNWWFEGQKDVFDVSVWNDYEHILLFCLENGIYVFPFDGMVGQKDEEMLSEAFVRYKVARFGAYASYMGYSPTWEWTEVWSASHVDSIMRNVKHWNPFPTLLSVHDCSDGGFVEWLGFSMRQQQSRTLFDGNCRLCGQNGGVESPFDDQPIIGSEDIWETSSGSYGQPRNADEVRRGAWGSMMAGVIPLYSEWYNGSDQPGNMPGEAEVRRMFDFFYSKTRYREYRSLNHLVSRSERQAASGIPGQEYLVYDEDGGSISVDLSGASASSDFSVLWFDPKTGATKGEIIQGGASRTLDSPFGEDTVLLLTAATGECPSITFSISQRPPVPTWGCLYLALQITEVPGWDDFTWFISSDDQASSSVRLAKTKEGFLPGAADLEYARGALGGEDLSFEVDRCGLKGHTLILETMYLEESKAFREENLRSIQRIEVDCE